MSDFRGYKGRSLKFLKDNGIKIGDSVEITAEKTYQGILMPRYEHGDEYHIVLKLRNGYNVGIETEKITKIQLLESAQIQKQNVFLPKKNLELPTILLISTGGTIASKIDYRTGAVTPALSAAELYEIVPEIGQIANIETEVLFSEYSENLLPEHWQKIAKRLDSAKSDYNGIIVAHGTDTMHYTASFLSFALSGFPIPVALVGSQRSADRPSSDATLNLVEAVRFVVNCNTKGIFIVMHHNESDDIIACHLGTRVRKNHTSKRGAFQTVGSKPAYFLTNRKIEKNLQSDMFKQNNYTPKFNFDTKIALIKYYPGFDPTLIDTIIKNKFKGIIFEGTGLGHVGRTMYEIVKKAKASGLFVGMTSQCIDGRVGMTVYESGRDLLEMGVIPLSNMIPETALVKAMWVSGNFDGSKEIEKMMLKNISSEFSD